MSKRQQVERKLREAGPRGVTTAEFLEDGGCGSRFGARVQELRRLGLSIEVECVRPGCYRYTLLQEPAAPTRPAKAGHAFSRLFEPPAAAPMSALLHDYDGGHM